MSKGNLSRIHDRFLLFHETRRDLERADEAKPWIRETLLLAIFDQR